MSSTIMVSFYKTVSGSEWCYVTMDVNGINTRRKISWNEGEKFASKLFHMGGQEEVTVNSRLQMRHVTLCRIV